MSSNQKNKYIGAGSCFGGCMADYPGWEDRLRSKLFPDIKLRVDISISSYAAVGGMHYYPNIRIDADPFWDPKEKMWITCWDHPREYNSKCPSTYDLADEVPFPEKGMDDGKFASSSAVLTWLEQVITKCFPTDKYEVHCDFKRKRVSLKDRQRYTQGD
jgi:hypothetical protein